MLIVISLRSKYFKDVVGLIRREDPDYHTILVRILDEKL